MGKILITAIGSMSAPYVIQSFKNAGYVVYGTDIYPKDWISTSADVFAFFQISTVKHEQDYVISLLKICIENNISFIIPLTDLEIDVLLKNINIFKDKGVTVCISNAESLLISRDKYQIYKQFKKSKLVNVIPTYNHLNINLNSIQFPLIAKPKNGRSSEGTFIIKNKNIFNINDDLRYIYQPFYDGEIITVDVVRDKNVIICLARKELIRTKNGAGLTVQVIVDQKINDVVEEITLKLNLEGVFNIEFIKYEEDYFLMDINPRFSAGIAFSGLAGYNFVINHLNVFRGFKVDDLKKINCAVFKRKYVEL